MTKRFESTKSKTLPVLVFLGVFVVGVAAVIGTVVAGQGEGVVGPDIVVFDLYQTLNWGTVGDKTAYSVGTISCNRGDEPAQWVSNTNEHPVIAQNLYRLKDGRLEQIGMSWLKHGFYALAQSDCGTCENPGTGSLLGVNCSDPYTASLNGGQNRLGPRSPVNAFTGYYPENYPSPGQGTLDGRIQVATSDVEPSSNPSALYFVEGQYITADDATRGNGLNNVSYREVTVEADLDLFLESTTQETIPAIEAWAINDPDVTTTVVQVAGEGIFNAAYKAIDNGNGTWRYEYAIHNLNSDRSGEWFQVPILPGTVITNEGFHDVDYHSGEPFSNVDWSISIDAVGGSVTWAATQDYATNPDANALRWGTMYNFWFDADVAPNNAMASLGLFKPGAPGDPAMVEFTVLAPAAAGLVFVDGFESGDTSAWSGAVE